MDVEDKLDEDFLFYLSFTNSAVKKITDCGDQALVQRWLQRLCGQPCQTVDAKRFRNIFLSNLILQMQDGKLGDPFTKPPDDVDMTQPENYFPTIQKDVILPDWVNEGTTGDDDADYKGMRDDGRTYVATRAMPNGEGAFAYVAVSLTDGEEWLGGQEGAFDRAMEEKFKIMVPAPNEMEIILARRKDVKERQRVLTFYDVMLQNIADELDEKITEEDNNAITVVLQQLVEDLKRKGQYEQFDAMSCKERRMELLLILFDRTKARRDKVAHRESILDDIEASFRSSFFEGTVVGEEDRYEMPSAMWEYVINRPPNKANLDQMHEMYPHFVVEKMLELLSDQKEEIAIRMQRRHQNIVSQMRHELRKESDKLKKRVDEAKNNADQGCYVLKDVKEVIEKQRHEIEKAKKRKKGGETAKTELYNQMRETIFDTQTSVEEEAERGRVLTEQINTLNEQAEVYNQITECSIIKTEEANMTIMKNIKKLRQAIRQHETRLDSIKSMKEHQRDAQAKTMMMIC